PVSLEQLVGDREVAARREQLARLDPDIRSETALPIGEQRALHRELAFGDADAPLLAPVEIERQRDANSEVVVRADRLLSAKLQHRIGPQRGLTDTGRHGVDLGPGSAELRVLDERTGDQLVDGDVEGLAAGHTGATQYHTARTVPARACMANH